MEALKDLIRNNSFCVLATCADDQPHCSLMSYAADDDCREIFMLTQADTRKFRNLSLNPSVSLLIDSRTQSGMGPVRALTLGGRVQRVGEPGKKERVRQLLLKAHPELGEFILSAEAVFLSMEIETSQIFEGLKQVE